MGSIKYLVTVDSDSGAPTKLEMVGDAGELTEVELSKLFQSSGYAGGVSIAVNIYTGNATVNRLDEGNIVERDVRKWHQPAPNPPPPRR
jgi:hypothetical protein